MVQDRHSSCEETISGVIFKYTEVNILTGTTLR